MKILNVTIKNDRTNPGRDGYNGINRQIVTYQDPKGERRQVSGVVEWGGELSTFEYKSPGERGPWVWTDYGLSQV